MLEWPKLLKGTLIKRYKRMDVTHFEPANHIDSLYSEELKKAYNNGVEVITYDVNIETKGIAINKPDPYKL